jgi:hypothetical protein
MKQSSLVWVPVNAMSMKMRVEVEAHAWELGLECLPWCVQGRVQVSNKLCWQLHPEQLQLAPAAAGLVSALTEAPIEADRQSMRLADPPGLMDPSPSPCFHGFQR